MDALTPPELINSDIRFSDGSYLGEPFQLPGLDFFFEIRFDASGKGQTIHARRLGVSDIHLGTHHARAKKTEDMLHHFSADLSTANGDIVDGEHMEDKDWHNMPPAHIGVIALMLRLTQWGRLIDPFGNHDIKLQKWVGKKPFGIEIVEEFSDIDPRGRHVLYRHGHQDDAIVMGKHQAWWWHFGGKLNNLIGCVDIVLKILMPWLEDFSFAAWCKRYVKLALNHGMGVRKATKQSLIQDEKYDIYDNGHSHMRERTEIDINEYEQSRLYKIAKFILRDVCGVKLAKIGQIEKDNHNQNGLQKAVRFLAQDCCGFYLQNVPTKIMRNSGCCTEHVQCRLEDSKGNGIQIQWYQETASFDAIDDKGQERRVYLIEFNEHGLDFAALDAEFLQKCQAYAYNKEAAEKQGLIFDVEPPERIERKYINEARALERIMCRLWPSQQRQEAARRVKNARQMQIPGDLPAEERKKMFEKALDRPADRTVFRRTVHTLWRASKDGWLARQEAARKQAVAKVILPTWQQEIARATPKPVLSHWQEAAAIVKRASTMAHHATLHMLWKNSYHGWLERQQSIGKLARDIADHGHVPSPTNVERAWPKREKEKPRSVFEEMACVG